MAIVRPPFLGCGLHPLTHSFIHPHPHCLLSSVAAGQVISRLKLSWWGGPGTTAEAAVAYKIILAAVVAYWAVFRVFFFVVDTVDPNNDRSEYDPINDPAAPWYQLGYFLRNAVELSAWLGTTIVLENVRRSVRLKYAIRAADANGMEDFCCSCWCPCLVAPQMLRHTTGTLQLKDRMF